MSLPLYYVLPIKTNECWVLTNGGYAIIKTVEQIDCTVESAILYQNGTQHEISPDDPRLIFVINFLAYSGTTRQDSYTQGTIDEEKVARYYSSEVPMLEITFTVDPNNTDYGLRRVPKILVGGDSFLYMNSADSRAVVVWPYAVLRPENANYNDVLNGWEED